MLALTYAAAKGCERAMAALLAAGANVDSVMSSGVAYDYVSPLRHAIHLKHKNIALTLVEASA
jgi:ankyrin repeat protein